MNKRLVLFLVAALCLCFTTVSAYNVVDEIVELVLEKRQDNNDTTAVTTTTTTEPAPDTSTTTTITTSTTEITTSDETTPTPTPTPSETESSTSSQEEQTTSTADGEPSSTTTTEVPTSTEETMVSLITTTRTREVTTIIFTVSGTLSSSVVYTSEVQTTTPTSTNSDSGDKEDNGDGISISTRNTIIGVVVGVGGAIIIGALVFVGFRLRRKKSTAVYDDDTRATPSSTNPLRQQDAFKATLDQYHKPPGTVNPSANF